MTSQTKIDSAASGVLAGPAGPGGVEIQCLRGESHASEVERLQAEIWGVEEAWIVPSHVLLIVAEYGGILLGARVDGMLVGFVLGFLARTEGRFFHASHMLGVLPAWRQHGIGAALKRRQREVARQQGLDLMRWTFDPLEARNAHVNLHKLGAVCHVYRQDYYGPMQDALNRDLPSDRLLVEWNLEAPESRPDQGGTPPPVLRNIGGRPVLQWDAIAPDLPIAIAVPGDLQTIKRDAPEVALAWRQAVREAFTLSFERGYQACDFRDGMYILLPRRAAANKG